MKRVISLMLACLLVFGAFPLSLAVVAEGEDLTYKWQYKIAGNSRWRACSSSTAGYNESVLHVVATAARNGFAYRCVVTSGENSETSDPATLTVAPAPSFGIISQPQDVSIAEGETADFAVAAEGEDLTYKWQYRIAGSSKWRACSSSTAGYNEPVLHVVATAARNGFAYRCIVTSGEDSETSSAATLTVTAPGPQITADPQNQSVASGGTAHFTVAATGDGLTYQWQYKIAGQTTWRDCSPKTTGYQSTELEVVGTAARNGYQYRCVVTDENGETAASAAATLTVE